MSQRRAMRSRLTAHRLTAHRLTASTRLVLLFATGLLLSASCSPRSSSEPSMVRQDTAAPGSPDSLIGPSESSESVIQVQAVEGALDSCVFRNGSEFNGLYLPETTGGGLGLLDYDNDGHLDVLSAGGGVPDNDAKTLRGLRGNLCRGLPDFQFLDVTESTRFDASAVYNSAIVIADFNADGFDDALVTGFSGLQWFCNQGDGTFESLPVADIGLADQGWSSDAALFDANGDGLLDLYVTHYADWSFDNNPRCVALKESGSREQVADYCGPRQFKGLPDSLYLNVGDGSWRDVSTAAGLDQQLRGLGVLAADLDGDRDIDLYVSNDVDPNLLYRNDGNMQFTEIARRSGVACNDLGIPEGSMGIALGDYNSDGKLDLWVTNYQNEIGGLYRNNGNMLFTYVSNATRIRGTDEASVGWGTAFCDIDLDGDEDLVVVNGHIEMHPLGSTFQQRPQVLENIDGKYFRLAPQTAGSFLATRQSSRGLALGDFDRDGKMDFAVSRVNTQAVLVRNRTPTSGCYLRVRLIGTQSDRNAIGVTANLTIGDETWIRQIVGGGSYASTSERAMHFGLPAECADQSGTLVLHWPSGIEQTVAIDALSRELLIVEGE